MKVVRDICMTNVGLFAGLTSVIPSHTRSNFLDVPGLALIAQPARSTGLQSYQVQVHCKSYKVIIKQSKMNTSSSVLAGNGIYRELSIPLPWQAEFSDDRSHRPTVLPLQSPRPVMVVVCKRISGTWGFRSLILFQLSKGHWNRILADPERTSFSNRGSFLIEKEKLTIWDIVYDVKTAHWAPQRYKMSTFNLMQGRLKLVQSRLTKHAYIGGQSIGPLSYPKPSDDPLTEFGRQWKWWGSSKV